MCLSQQADVAAPASGARLVEHLFTRLQFFCSVFMDFLILKKSYICFISLTLTGQ